MVKHEPNDKNAWARALRSERGVFFNPKSARLYLSDGKTFAGQVPDWQKQAAIGEVVFNTGMSGYVESLTDPSYTNQILVFTYPLIGNYGVQLGDAESGKIQVKGVVMSELALSASHPQATLSFLEWLHSQDIPLLTGVDTRALTKYLRSRGTMLGAISPKPVKLRGIKPDTTPVSITEPILYGDGKGKQVILVDCGAKENIVRSLVAQGLRVKRVPYDYDYTGEAYDGVVLSNGPGDPTDYQATIDIARKALKGSKPVFGICLGNQIMGLAAGGSTYKLLYGHRGHNQPCIDVASERCYITSQNHGYALDEKSLPRSWRVSFRNLNDNSVEGIAHRTKPFFAVQFHPEASPGPTDSRGLFDQFRKLL